MNGFGEECRKVSKHSQSFRMKTTENSLAGNNQQRQLARDNTDESQCEMCWERTRLSTSTYTRCFKNVIRNPKPYRNNIQPFLIDWTLYGIEMLVVPIANTKERNVIGLKCQDVKSIDFKIRNDQFTQKGGNLYSKKSIKANKDIPIPLSNYSATSITTILLIILMAITYATAAVQETHQWDVSMVVDNVDYTSGMEKNMSREFTDLTDTLCLGLSGYLMEKKEQRVGCHVERLRKSATSKVEVSLTIDNLPLKVFGSKDKVLNRILQESRHFNKNGKDYIEIKSYLIPTTSIHVVQKTETGPQLSKPILDSERPRRGVNTSKLLVVSEGAPVVTTTPKSRVTTVEIVWATNWWDVLLSKYQWGEDDFFGSETGATLSRLPDF